MLVRYIGIKRNSNNRILKEKIQRELAESLEKKGVNVSKITIDLSSGLLCIGVYMSDKIYIPVQSEV